MEIDGGMLSVALWEEASDGVVSHTRYAILNHSDFHQTYCAFC
jgi:hypothetical protein